MLNEITKPPTSTNNIFAPGLTFILILKYN